jgi:phosphatidate cytidylyltransferase
MFVTRLVTAVLALAAFLAALFLLSRPWWTACLLPGLFLGAREWALLDGSPGARATAYGAATTLLALLVLAAGPTAGTEDASQLHLAVYALALVFWIFVAVPWLRFHWRVSGWWRGVAGWIVLIPTWLAFVQLQERAPVLLVFLGVVWIADTAAYLSGRAWGRHKLAPVVSPGKTWEGVVGAAVAVLAYYAVLQASLDTSLSALRGPPGVLAFAALLALSIVGDLFESLMKRQAGVKDSGALLPGHGGVLDRIDGLTSTLPAVALLVLYVR